MRYRLPILFLAAVLALSACNRPVASVTSPRAWVDDPLDGMVLPLQPYTLTLHSSDPQGISRMEVSVNGAVLATLINPEPAQLLFYQTLNWEPAAPGRYVIGVRAQNVSGVWSAEDRVTVEIKDTLTPTPTREVLTDTPSATGTATPTATFTPAGMEFSSHASVREFNYARDCIPNPDSVTITVKVSPAAKIRNVYLFFRLKSQSGDVLTRWENVVMTPIGNSTYQSTIVWSDISGLSEISTHGLSAWFQYQFVADDISGAILGRSQVLWDIILAPCH